MAYNYDARSTWASQTIKKTQHFQPPVMERVPSGLHAYPALKHSHVRFNSTANPGEKHTNLEVSRTVPRVDVVRHNFALEKSVLERIKKMEEQDQKIAENRRKLINSKKLQEEQAEKVKQLDMERKRREEEAKLKAEEDEKTKKITEYASITGELDRHKIRTELEKHNWDLETAISLYFSKSDEQVPGEREGEPDMETVKITIYVDNVKHVWTFKPTETLWDLYTMIARMGKNESFHFVDSNQKKYREHMFENSFANAGWVPEVTLTVCKDDPKPRC